MGTSSGGCLAGQTLRDRERLAGSRPTWHGLMYQPKTASPSPIGVAAVSMDTRDVAPCVPSRRSRPAPRSDSARAPWWPDTRFAHFTFHGNSHCLRARRNVARSFITPFTSRLAAYEGRSLRAWWASGMESRYKRKSFQAGICQPGPSPSVHGTPTRRSQTTFLQITSNTSYNPSIYVAGNRLEVTIRPDPRPTCVKPSPALTPGFRAAPVPL